MGKSRISTRVAAAMLIVSLAACGQKGALYLPDRNGAVVTRPGPTNSPATEETSPAAPAATGPSNQVPPNGTVQPPQKRDQDGSQPQTSN